jgi:hypothetical protein
LKVQFENWLFHDGIEYHPEIGLRTGRECLIYSIIEKLQSVGSHVVDLVPVRASLCPLHSPTPSLENAKDTADTRAGIPLHFVFFCVIT